MTEAFAEHGDIPTVYLTELRTKIGKILSKAKLGLATGPAAAGQLLAARGSFSALINMALVALLPGMALMLRPALLVYRNRLEIG